MWEISANSCSPRHPKWETNVGDKCKLMQPKAPRVGDKYGKQVWETSANSCSPRHPEWETNVGYKCKLMQPKAPRVGDSVGDK